MIKKKVFMDHFYHRVTDDKSYLSVADYHIVYYLFGFPIKTVLVKAMSPHAAFKALDITPEQYGQMIKELKF